MLSISECSTVWLLRSIETTDIVIRYEVALKADVIALCWPGFAAWSF